MPPKRRLYGMWIFKLRSHRPRSKIGRSLEHFTISASASKAAVRLSSRQLVPSCYLPVSLLWPIRKTNDTKRSSANAPSRRSSESRCRSLPMSAQASKKAPAFSWFAPLVMPPTWSGGDSSICRCGRLSVKMAGSSPCNSAHQGGKVSIQMQPMHSIRHCKENTSSKRGRRLLIFYARKAAARFRDSVRR